MTQIAPDAPGVIDHQRAGRGTAADRVHRAHIGAIGVLALIADRREMVEIFARVADVQQGRMGIVAPVKALGTRQLAQPASGTDVEIGFDKYLCGQSAHVQAPGF
jgi:hypothetical protein